MSESTTPTELTASFEGEGKALEATGGNSSSAAGARVPPADSKRRIPDDLVVTINGTPRQTSKSKGILIETLGPEGFRPVVASNSRRLTWRREGDG